MADGDGDGNGSGDGDATLNFYCRLPNVDKSGGTRAQRAGRSVDPPRMAWLQRILDANASLHQAQAQAQQQQQEVQRQQRPSEPSSSLREGRGRPNGEASTSASANAGASLTDDGPSNIADSVRRTEAVEKGEAADTSGGRSANTHGKVEGNGASLSDASSEASTKAVGGGEARRTNGDGVPGSSPAGSSAIDEEEAPWFSQLANLPQVRSAGVPLLPPSPMQQRTKDAKSSLALRSRSSNSSTTSSLWIRSNSGPKSSSLATRAATTRDGGLPPDSSSSSAESNGIASTAPSAHVHSMSGANSRSLALPVFDGSKAAPPVGLGIGGGSASAIGAATTTSSTAAPLVPPENFAMVNSWVYRSSFPKKRHFPFLKTLGLRSVL